MQLHVNNQPAPSYDEGDASGGEDLSTVVFNVHVIKVRECPSSAAHGYGARQYSFCAKPFGHGLRDRGLEVHAAGLQSWSYGQGHCTGLSHKPANGLPPDMIAAQGSDALVFECESDGTFVAINHVSHEPAEGGPPSASAYTVSQLYWVCSGGSPGVHHRGPN